MNTTPDRYDLQRKADTMDPETTTDTGTPAGVSRPGLLTMVRGLAWDVGLPLVTYYALHLFGASDWVALLAATLAAGARVVWVALRSRSANLFAILMLVVFGLGLAMAFLSGDARFLLLKDSITTGAVGITFLLTAALGRPLTLAAMKVWQPGTAEEMTTLFRTVPEFRHGHLVASTVWGAGLLTEALVRIPLIYLLPIDVMVGLSTALMIAAFGGLIAWTGWYTRWAGRRAGLRAA